MADRYELFTDPLAQAIAEGRKTVTRRPVTKSTSRMVAETRASWAGLDWPNAVANEMTSGAGTGLIVAHSDGRIHGVAARSKVGDTLIVRECWHHLSFPDGQIVVHRANYVPGHSHWHESIKPKWRPSIHMPRWVARSRRLIVSVTPELLGLLSQEEAEREGFDSPEAFEDAWSGIYGEDVRWVWRTEFTRTNVV